MRFYGSANEIGNSICSYPFILTPCTPANVLFAPILTCVNTFRERQRVVPANLEEWERGRKKWKMRFVQTAPIPPLSFEITLIRRLKVYLLSVGSLGYQAERGEKFTDNFAPVRRVERKRGGLILKSLVRTLNGTSSFPAKLDLVSRSSSSSIPAPLSSPRSISLARHRFRFLSPPPHRNKLLLRERRIEHKKLEEQSYFLFTSPSPFRK